MYSETNVISTNFSRRRVGDIILFRADLFIGSEIRRLL